MFPCSMKKVQAISTRDVINFWPQKWYLVNAVNSNQYDEYSDNKISDDEISDDEFFGDEISACRKISHM